jgi:cyclase
MQRFTGSGEKSPEEIKSKERLKNKTKKESPMKIFMKKSTIVWVLALSAGLCLSFGQTPQASQASPQQKPQQAPPPLTVQNIKGAIYMVKGGSGANSGFFIGEKEVLVIDAKMTSDSARQEIEEIKKLTSNPITTIVLTHSDGDHVNGLTGFPKGLRIIAHSQCKKEMEDAFKQANQLDLMQYLPHQTITDSQDLMFGNERIRLLYFGPAHTSGDIVVFFPAEKVVFPGDLVFLGRDPLIHRQKGGTSFGLVKNLKALVALDAQTYLPGHVDSASKADIEGLVKSIEEKQAKIQALVKEGKSLDEIRQEFGIQQPPAQAGQSAARRFPSLVEVIYQEITEKK